MSPDTAIFAALGEDVVANARCQALPDQALFQIVQASFCSALFAWSSSCSLLPMALEDHMRSHEWLSTMLNKTAVAAVLLIIALSPPNHASDVVQGLCLKKPK